MPVSIWPKPNVAVPNPAVAVLPQMVVVLLSPVVAVKLLRLVVIRVAIPAALRNGSVAVCWID